jgi:hypothetical protein
MAGKVGPRARRRKRGAQGGEGEGVTDIVAVLITGKEKSP